MFVLENIENNLDQESLLHFYNNTIDSGGQILFTARSAPSPWGMSLSDLESRLRAVPSISIGIRGCFAGARFGKTFSDPAVTSAL